MTQRAGLERALGWSRQVRLASGVLRLVSAMSLLSLGGCFSFVDWSHNLDLVRDWNRELNRLNGSMDDPQFSYDYDDPSRDIPYQNPAN